MGYLDLYLTRKVKRASKRGNAGACLLSTAMKQQWGAEASTTGSGMTATRGSVRKHYKHTVVSFLTMFAFDCLPFVPLPGKVRMKTYNPRARNAKMAGGIAGAIGGGLLIVTGFAWVIFAIAGLMAVVVALLVALAKANGGSVMGTAPEQDAEPVNTDSRFKQAKAAAAADQARRAARPQNAPRAVAPSYDPREELPQLQEPRAGQAQPIPGDRPERIPVEPLPGPPVEVPQVPEPHEFTEPAIIHEPSAAERAGAR